MRLNHTGFMPVMLLCACGSLKNTQHSQQLQLKDETDSFSLTTKNRQRSTTALITDSSSAAYHVEIIPVGPFTYDAARGFQGAAAKVILKGKQQSKMQQQLETTSLENMNQASLLKDKREYRKVEQAQEKTRLRIPAWLWVSLIIVALSGCLYFLIGYRKLWHL